MKPEILQWIFSQTVFSEKDINDEMHKYLALGEHYCNHYT